MRGKTGSGRRGDGVDPWNGAAVPERVKLIHGMAWHGGSGCVGVPDAEAWAGSLHAVRMKQCISGLMRSPVQKGEIS
jgi:hypothetical protein